jgi:hypothetical protein
VLGRDVRGDGINAGEGSRGMFEDILAASRRLLRDMLQLCSFSARRHGRELRMDKKTGTGGLGRRRVGWDMAAGGGVRVALSKGEFGWFMDVVGLTQGSARRGGRVLGSPVFCFGDVDI